jgi:hypothetical protein
MDSFRLQDIFDLALNLRHLEIHYDGHTTFDVTPPPLYLPSSSNSGESRAIKYDLLWRPQRMFISRMDSITSLTILGHPSVDMEEAVFKLSLRMKERANQEAQRIEETEKGILWGPNSERKWLYKLEIKR